MNINVKNNRCKGSLTLVSRKGVFYDGECGVCGKPFGEHMQLKTKASGSLVYKIPAHNLEV